MSSEITAHCLHEADGHPAYLHRERPPRARANPPGEYARFAISDFHRPIMLSFLTLSRLRKSKNARRTAAPIWRLTRIPRRGNHMHSRSDPAAILSPKRLLMGSALFSAFAFAPAVQAQSVPATSQSDAASPVQDARTEETRVGHDCGRPRKNRGRQTRCAVVTGVQTCAHTIYGSEKAKMRDGPRHQSGA